jgi:D-alanyl-D-alanine carboxypeptidase-like protein
MYCTITVGLLLSNVSVASLHCSNFDQIAEVQEEPKVQIASVDHSYVPLPPAPQPKKSEIKIGTTTINLEQSNIKNMSLLVVHTPDNVLKTSVASEHASKFVCLLKKLMATGYPIKDIGGYSYRKIFGTNYLSLHAYGKALDVNQVRYNEVTVQQPKHATEMAHECGLDSGAEWGTPDIGHFEVPTEGYGTRIARSDATGQGGILSYASSKIQQFWNWSVY